MTRKTYYAPAGASPEGESRKAALVRNLNRLMLKKGWRQTDLAREAQRHLPKNQTFGRHLISSYMTGKNMPTQVNLEAMAKALGVDITDIVPETAAEYVGAEPPAMTMSFTAGGKARVTLDMEMSADKAARIMAVINEQG